MKRVFLLLLLFSVFSCIGPDAAFLPQTLKESEKSKLLIAVYSVSDKYIKINEENFEIIEVWSTQKFIKRNSKKVNTNFFDIRIRLRNTATGEIVTPSTGFGDYIKVYCDDNSNFGIHDSMLSITYYDIKLKDKVNSFKIGFIDNKKNEKIIVFTRQ